MEIYKKQSLAETFKVYFDKRMIKILLLGAISGFPWVIIGSSLSLWLKEDGLSRSTVGWAGLIFAVYAFNYLWAPIIDRIKIPWLTTKVGHRRAWIITMQFIILICLVSWSLINPSANVRTEHRRVSLKVVGMGAVALETATVDVEHRKIHKQRVTPDARVLLYASRPGGCTFQILLVSAIPFPCT